MKLTIYNDAAAKAKYSYEAGHENRAPVIRFHDFEGFIQYVLHQPHLLDVWKSNANGEVRLSRRSRADYVKENEYSESSTNYFTHECFIEALQHARRGWPDGLSRLKESLFELEHLLGNDYETHYSPQVEGDFLDMTSYLEGIPECWLDEVEEFDNVKPSGKVVYIRVCISLPWYVSRESYFNYGAAALYVSKLLTLQGYSVGIILGYSIQNKKSRDSYLTSVVVKRPDDFFDEDRLAFSICSSDFLRRFMWSIAEQQREGESNKAYGGQLPELKEDQSLKGYEVFNLSPGGGVGLPSRTFNDRWGTIKEAEKSIKSLIKNSGLARATT